MDELFAQLRIFQESNIHGRGVWLYEVSCSVGLIYIVQYEKHGLELETKLFYYDYTKAKRYYETVAGKILKGVL